MADVSSAASAAAVIISSSSESSNSIHAARRRRSHRPRGCRGGRKNRKKNPASTTVAAAGGQAFSTADAARPHREQREQSEEPQQQQSQSQSQRQMPKETRQQQQLANISYEQGQQKIQTWNIQNTQQASSSSTKTTSTTSAPDISNHADQSSIWFDRAAAKQNIITNSTYRHAVAGRHDGPSSSNIRRQSHLHHHHHHELLEQTQTLVVEPQRRGQSRGESHLGIYSADNGQQLPPKTLHHGLVMMGQSQRSTKEQHEFSDPNVMSSHCIKPAFPSPSSYTAPTVESDTTRSQFPDDKSSSERTFGIYNKGGSCFTSLAESTATIVTPLYTASTAFPSSSSSYASSTYSLNNDKVVGEILPPPPLLSNEQSFAMMEGPNPYALTTATSKSTHNYTSQQSPPSSNATTALSSALSSSNTGSLLSCAWAYPLECSTALLDKQSARTGTSSTQFLATTSTNTKLAMVQTLPPLANVRTTLASSSHGQLSSTILTKKINSYPRQRQERDPGASDKMNSIASAEQLPVIVKSTIGIDSKTTTSASAGGGATTNTSNSTMAVVESLFAISPRSFLTGAKADPGSWFVW
ncbi:hypothetical protein ACA910_015680 [Epithemia clementina (nom. ined.)]